MEKVVLEHNKDTGELKDANGMYVTNYIGDLYSFEAPVGVDTLVKLKNAGYTADEIIELKRKDII